MLRTRAPVVSGIATLLPLDLHVLGLPLALILSQDQTLHSKVDLYSLDSPSKVVPKGLGKI